MKLCNEHPNYEYIIIDRFTGKELFIEVVILDKEDHEDQIDDEFWVLVTFQSDCFNCEIVNDMTEEHFFRRYNDSHILWEGE